MTTAATVANTRADNPAPAPTPQRPLGRLSYPTSSNTTQTRNLVPVTLVDADLLHADTCTVAHLSDSATTSRPPIRTWVDLRLKLLQTRVNGRLSLWSFRLPPCVRRRLDKRRAAKWTNRDTSSWNNAIDSSNDYWTNLGTPNQLSGPTTADANSDDSPALPTIQPRRVGSFMGGGLAGNGFAPPPHAFDEHYKAYSMAMFPRAERENVSYGGKSA